MQPQEFMDFVHILEGLKCRTRHSYTSTLRHESVAEHTFRIAAMALLLEGEFPGLDMAKVIKMCLVHDWGEAVTGDIPSFLKTDGDEEREVEAVEGLLSRLPDRKAGLGALFAELNALETPEAKLYKALDRIEAVIQHNEAPLSTWIERERTLNLEYGVSDCAAFPFMAELRAIAARETEAEAESGRISRPQPFQPARRSSSSERGAARFAKSATKLSKFGYTGIYSSPAGRPLLRRFCPRYEHAAGLGLLHCHRAGAVKMVAPYVLELVLELCAAPLLAEARVDVDVKAAVVIRDGHSLDGRRQLHKADESSPASTRPSAPFPGPAQSLYYGYRLLYVGLRGVL